MMISFLFGQPQKISGTLLFYFSNMISISWLSAHSINYNIHINALTHWRAHTHTLTHAQIGFNSDCSVLFKRFLFSLIPIFAYIEVYRGDVNFDWWRPKWSLPSKRKIDSNWILHTSRLQLYFEQISQQWNQKLSFSSFFLSSIWTHTHTHTRQCSSLCATIFTETFYYFNFWFRVDFAVFFEYYVWMKFHSIVNGRIQNCCLTRTHDLGDCLR